MSMRAIIKNNKIVRIIGARGPADWLHLKMVTSEANRQKAKNLNFDYTGFIVRNIS